MIRRTLGHPDHLGSPGSERRSDGAHSPWPARPGSPSAWRARGRQPSTGPRQRRPRPRTTCASSGSAPSPTPLPPAQNRRPESASAAASGPGGGAAAGCWGARRALVWARWRRRRRRGGGGGQEAWSAGVGGMGEAAWARRFFSFSICFFPFLCFFPRFAAACSGFVSLRGCLFGLLWFGGRKEGSNT